MNTNGLARSAMTRSSTTTSDSLPWLSGLSTSCQSSALLSSTPASTSTAPGPPPDHHLMLPQSAPVVGYRGPDLSSSGRYSFTTTSGGSAYPTPSSLYSHAGLAPYSMFQHYAAAAAAASHPGLHPDMAQQQTFSSIIASHARFSQYAGQPSLPRPYPGGQYPAPSGSPGLHPTPLLQPHPLYSRDGRRDPGPRARHSPAHYSGLTVKDLPPPTGGPPRPSHDHKLDKDEYRRRYHGIDAKGDEPPPHKRHKVGGPPPLHASHTATTSAGPSLPPPPPLHPFSYPSHPHYPPHFMKGSIIQLANGELKRVEDLKTEDFVNSADISDDLKIDSSTVVRIKEDDERSTAVLSFSVGEQRIQVTVEATVEHPFFVFGRGWSSCSPARTHRRYGLQCSQLSVGDVCISLTQKHLSVPSSSSSATTSSSSSSATTVTTATTRGQISGCRDARGGHSVRWGGATSSSPLPSELPQSRASSPPHPGAVRRRRWSAPGVVTAPCPPQPASPPATPPKTPPTPAT